MICSICGRTAPCEISQATSRPWCKACQKRRARCAGCGQVELIRGGTLTKPLCAACTRPGLSFWRSCPTCGHRQLSTRSCTRCNLRQRLAALLADGDGDVRADLRGLHGNLAGSERPNLVLAWLNKTAIASVLREFGTGQRALSHAALDELPASKPVEHLRAILVATNTLPPGMNTWPASNAGSHAPSPDTAIPGSSNAAPLRRLAPAAPADGSATTTPTPPTPKWSPCNATSKPLSHCSTDSPPTAAPWPAPARQTWTTG